MVDGVSLLTRATMLCGSCVAAAMFGAARHNEPNALEILITEGDGDVFSINAEGQTLAHAAMQEGDNPEVLVR